MIFAVVRDGQHEHDQTPEGRHEDEPVGQRGRLAARSGLGTVAAAEDRFAVAVGAACASAAGDAFLEAAQRVLHIMKGLARRLFKARLWDEVVPSSGSGHCSDAYEE